MDQYWLTIIIVVLLIVGIICDGVRRMRKARYDSLQMKLKPTKDVLDSGESDEKNYGSEFPNGGARVSEYSIDPERIKKARNKYNFGSDMSAWRERVVEKIAEHTSKLQAEDKQTIESRIEPVVEEGALLDNQTDHQDIASKTEYKSEAFASDEYFAQAGDDNEIRNGIGGQPLKAKTDRIEAQQPPVQVSLNLDESVPMLMDTFVEASAKENAAVTVSAEESTAEAVTKKSLNPFAKPSAESSLAAIPKKEPVINRKSTAKASVTMPEEVLAIHVRAAGDSVFYGSDLLGLILAHGLRFGAMDIFHCHAGEDGEGPILFSLSNMVKPGVFDLHTFEEFSTVGISLFLALPLEAGRYMEAFDAMLDTAKDIADKLDGELKDENRSVLTGQTIEHYRERIRDFSRREQLEKNKL